jgi:hypothetical protein
MCEAFPGVDLVHHTDELPQAPEEHPQFWGIWRASIRRHVPGRIDYVFASEDYGERLAAELDARFVPVDRERRNVPVSGRAIRQDPMAHWDDCRRRCAPTAEARLRLRLREIRIGRSAGRPLPACPCL